MPIGNFPAGVRFIVFLFPISHAAALFRQVIVPGVNHIPAEYQTHLGIHLSFGGSVVEPWVNIAVLVGTLVVFSALAVWSVSKKEN